MITVIARYTVQQDKVEEIKSAIVDFVNAVRVHEPGTLVYEAYQEADSASFTHFMVFRDDKARQLHENSSYVKNFTDILYPSCESEPVFSELNLVAANKG